MFNENSAIVGIWVRVVESGQYTRKQVPKLSNLQEEVYKKLDANAVVK